jgi:hypothetical protein
MENYLSQLSISNSKIFEFITKQTSFGVIVNIGRQQTNK